MASGKANLPDVISIGDSTTDVFFEIAEDAAKVRPKKRGEKLCFDAARPVPVRGRTEVRGSGNAANVAVGLSRLGLKTSLVTIVGDDDAGKETLGIVMKEEKVDTRHARKIKGERTNISLILNYAAERTIVGYHAPCDYALPELPAAKAVYLTSMGKGWEKALRSLTAYKKRTRALVVFNPGTQQLRSGRRALIKALKLSDVVFTNKEEAQKITEDRAGGLKELAEGLRKIGPAVAVVTDGAGGAAACGKDGCFFMPIVPAKVVERTGGGDAFAAGVTAHLVRGGELAEALVRGALNAASVIEKIGARAGLLNESGMKTAVSACTVKPEKI